MPSRHDKPMPHWSLQTEGPIGQGSVKSQGKALGMPRIKAAVCTEFGAPLSIEELDLRAPLAGEIEVTLEAVAICHSDISYAEGAWSGPLPAVYGHEAAGKISAVGPGVNNLRVGDDVVAIGNALALGDEPSVTKGIVSAKNRSIGDGEIELHHLPEADELAVAETRRRARELQARVGPGGWLPVLDVQLLGGERRDLGVLEPALPAALELRAADGTPLPEERVVGSLWRTGAIEALIDAEHAPGA